MSVDGAVITNPEIIENDARGEKALQARFSLVGEFASRLSPDPLHKAGGIFVQMDIARIRDQAVEVIRHGTHIFRDRPFVVIEDNDEFFRGGGDIVKSFETHAASERRIPCDADHMLVRAEGIACGCHA